MNTAILKRLSYEQLLELKQETEKEINNRMDFSVRVGRTGYFLDNAGIKRYCRVERINPKSVSVKDLEGKTAGWRVPASVLVMDGKPKESFKPRPRTPSTSPAETYNVESW